MSADYIRRCYGVPAKRGMRVRFSGQLGTIVGFRNQYLLVRLDGTERAGVYHPTWEIEYLTDGSSDE